MALAVLVALDVLLGRGAAGLRAYRSGNGCAPALAELPGIAAVRGRGLMIGVDLAEGISALSLARLVPLEQRLVINATGPATIRFEPPLIVGETEIDDALARVGELLAGGERA